MATATRKKKTVDDLKADLAAAKAKVAALEQKAYKSELSELISKSHFVADYRNIKASLKEVSDAVILSGIAKACGIKRIQITQIAMAPRKTKPKADGVPNSAKTKRAPAKKKSVVA